MDNSHNSDVIYQFSDYQLCGLTERLTCKNEELKVEPQQLLLLNLFVANPGSVISREQIEQAVWAGRPVSDEAIRAALKKLRDILQDDARSPRFIKTIPKQGYKWLAPVTRVKKQSLSDSPVNYQYRAVGALLLAFILAAILWLVLKSPAQPAQNTTSTSPSTPDVERLTQLPGSEINADYHQGQNKLAFIHRDSRNSPQQLYVKDLSTQIVTRLSWDEEYYSNVHWSADGTKLAFAQLEAQRQNHYIASFSDLGELQEIMPLTHKGLSDKYVLGWLPEDEGLLLAENMQPKTSHSLYALNFQTQEITRVSQPNVSGRGDYKAAISEDGTRLAILREEVPQTTTLLVTELQSGNLLDKVTLPFMPSRFIWLQDNQTIAMSSFFGEHARYNLATASFNSAAELPEHSLDLFSSCGTQCYILRQHNGNFLDIQETPLSALTDSNQDSDSAITLQAGRLFKHSNAQDFPQYLNTEGELFLTSLEKNQFLFQQLNRDNQLLTFATLHSSAQLSAVAVSPDNNRIAGAANGRLFIADVQVEAPPPAVTFITSALERYQNPVWHKQSQQLYVSQMSGNAPSIMLFDLESMQKTPVVSGYLAFSPLPENEELAIAIAPDLNAILMAKQEQHWQPVKTLSKVASAQPNQWQISQDALYFVRFHLPESFLCKVALHSATESPEEQCWSTGDNRFRLNFHINPDTQKVLLVESLSAESDIIKLQW